MDLDFKSAVELLALCDKAGCPISEIMRRRECELGETDRDTIEVKMALAL